jgi:uncharacterized membrane protein YdjX (TVP38/TMEM64 family)
MPPVQLFLLQLSNYGYLGAFIAGILFVSSFTVSIGALILFSLVHAMPAWQIGLVAGLGSVIGDLIIFRFIRDNLFHEILPLYNQLGGGHVKKVFKSTLMSKYFKWAIPVIGALIIASPMPDEIGVGMMGLSKIPTWQFAVLAFLLNAVGIFLVVSAAAIIKT